MTEAIITVLKSCRLSDFINTRVCTSTLSDPVELFQRHFLSVSGHHLVPFPLLSIFTAQNSTLWVAAGLTLYTMPSLFAKNGNPGSAKDSFGVTKFTNCLQVRGNDLVREDLWVSSISGRILNGQELLFEYRAAPDCIVDLGGRILSPGFIDTQLNGAYGFDFSVIPDEGAAVYGKGVFRVNRNLITTGVTSYLPTMTSQRPEVYHQVGRMNRTPYAYG